jgi:hypothetical protein
VVAPPAPPTPPEPGRDITDADLPQIRTWLGQGYSSPDGIAAHIPGGPVKLSQVRLTIAKLHFNANLASVQVDEVIVFAPFADDVTKLAKDRGLCLVPMNGTQGPPYVVRPAAAPPESATAPPSIPVAPGQVNPPEAPRDPGAPPVIAPNDTEPTPTDVYDSWDRDRLKAEAIARGLIDKKNRTREPGLRTMLREDDRAKRLATSGAAPPVPPVAPAAVTPPAPPVVTVPIEGGHATIITPPAAPAWRPGDPMNAAQEYQHAQGKPWSVIANAADNPPTPEVAASYDAHFQAPPATAPAAPVAAPPKFVVGMRVPGRAGVEPPEAALVRQFAPTLELRWYDSEGAYVVVERVAQAPAPSAPNIETAVQTHVEDAESIKAALAALDVLRDYFVRKLSPTA